MTRSYTLVQLRYFCAIARSGSMTSAAHELSVAQSTLSSAITQLEVTMGVQLFERLPRRAMKVSPSGRRLLAEAAVLLEQMENLPQVVHGGTVDLTGELVVGIFAPIASFSAASLLTEFARAHPRVDVRYLEGDQEETRQALASGRCDVALMYDVGLGEEYSISSVESIRPHVVVPVGHRLARRGEPIHLAEIASEPLVLLDLPHSRDYYLHLFEIIGVAPDVRHRLPGYEAVRSFVACGHGYSILNRRLPHPWTHAGREIAVLPLLDDLPSINVVVAHPPHGRPTHKALAFEQICRDVLSPSGAAAVEVPPSANS